MKKYIIILTAAVMAAISCTREEDKINRNIDTDADFVATVEGVVSSTDTKAGINEKGYVSWHVGDTISIIAEGSTEEGLYIVSTIDENSGQAYFTYFSGTKPEAGAAVHAYFPASLHKKKGQAGDITLPLNLYYDLDQSDRINYLPLHAYSTDKVLKFKNFCALMKVSVDQSTEVTRLQLVPSRQPVNGDFKIDKDGALTLVDGEPSLQLIVSNGKADAPVHEFYLPVPPGIYDDIKLCVNKPLEDMCWMNFMVPQMKFEANTIYPVNGKEKYWTSSRFMDDVYKFLGQNLGYDCQGDFSPLFALNLLGSEVMAADYSGHSDLAEFSTLTYSIDNKVVCKLSDAIYAALCLTNQVIETWGETGEPADKQPVAEARAIRAYLHYLLAMYFYQPYKMDHVLDVDESLKPCDGDSDPTTNLLKWCIEDCEKAAAALEYVKQRTTVTKFFAHALLSKLYLAVRGNPTECKTYYEKAIVSCDAIIACGNYELISRDKFADLFHAEGIGYVEKIFELVCTHDEGDLALFNWKSDAFAADPLPEYVSGGVGCIGVNQTFADDFNKNDKAEDGSHSTRFDVSVKFIKDAVGNENYIKEGGLKCQSFYLPARQLSRRSDIQRNFTVVRYAEVYLMHAEAKWKLGSTADATKSLNTIRERTGLSLLSSINLDDIKKEYRFEMFLDGQSWINERRWRDSTSFMEYIAQNQVITTLYDTLSRKVQQGEEAKFDETGRFYYLTTDLGTADLQKYYYLPYPKRFLASHPDMKQAPGW